MIQKPISKNESRNFEGLLPLKKNTPIKYIICEPKSLNKN